IIIPDNDHSRYEHLNSIIYNIKCRMKHYYYILDLYKNREYTIEEIIKAFQGETADGKGVFEYLRNQVHRLKQLGRQRCSETMESTLRSFMKFRGGIDLSLSNLSANIFEQYEAYLKGKGVTRNTSSFYMRNFRTAYKLAVEEGLTNDNQPFRKVYTGIDKTLKRAITIDDIRRIKSLDLNSRPPLDYAKDMLLFSFYMRGMSFVDMAYLRKKDLVNGYISYRRKKTGQHLTIEITNEAQCIISKYINTTQYVLPIITTEDIDARKQYITQLIRVNRHLKVIGKMVNLPIPLSTYVVRHAWATIARDKGINISIISEGLGHNNEMTTRIYLDSIRASKVDEANRSILDEL
ncbi:tyrosine-type recombinase/integrase, partial [Bacteroides caecigallinarum]|uniref:tyrosine-type recombinase/integrase n=1 Tax=Bacteroides caecigallinarum TaxID=1411144 RepID=UPI0021D4512F